MPGIGEKLRSERRRQGRTLADAAAETRVRESYLAALEEDDFDVLGGDVYARGFIRLYSKYLGLDTEILVAEFRRNHERPEEVTAIPGATIDEVRRPLSPGPSQLLAQPVVGALAVVGLLVVLFLVVRGGGEENTEIADPDAPGPAAAQTRPAVTEAGPSAPAVPAETPVAADEVAGEVMRELDIVVTAVEPLVLDVVRAQIPVSNAPLEPGESRTLTDAQQVSFTVSDASAAEITVNGGALVSPPEFAGRAVRITCTVGEAACNAEPL